jgi:hypothetical protein
VIVASVLRSGGDYDCEYVRRLADGVAKHLPSARFVCFSDVPVPCDRIPLLHKWPGWWAKMELFRLRGPVLYFDLDTVITGDLTDIAAQAHGGLVLLSDFFQPNLGQSGVMAWGGDKSRIYEGFAANADEIMERFRGDGEYIRAMVPEALRWQDLVPGQVVSRKVAGTRGHSERVVCFHGQPRPRDVGWEV